MCCLTLVATGLYSLEHSGALAMAVVGCAVFPPVSQALRSMLKPLRGFVVMPVPGVAGHERFLRGQHVDVFFFRPLIAQASYMDHPNDSGRSEIIIYLCVLTSPPFWSRFWIFMNVKTWLLMICKPSLAGEREREKKTPYFSSWLGFGLDAPQSQDVLQCFGHCFSISVCASLRLLPVKCGLWKPAICYKQTPWLTWNITGPSCVYACCLVF